jgi:hypothetical protein
VASILFISSLIILPKIMINCFLAFLVLESNVMVQCFSCDTYNNIKVPNLTIEDLPMPDNSSGVYNIFQALSTSKGVELVHGESNDCYKWDCKSIEKRGQKCQYCLPYVFVAGFSKCGTTAICSKLALHPRIKPYRKKEINIFTKFWDEFTWFDFEKRVVDTHREVTGDLWFDCTASVFRDFNALVHLLKYSPRSKLIFMVRDPWQRLGSWIEMNKRQKPKDSYRRYDHEWKVLLADSQPSRKSRFDREVLKSLSDVKYIGSFLYAEVLLKWRAAFQDKNILVLDHYDLENSPKETMLRVEDFLGISHHEYDLNQLLSLSVNTRFTTPGATATATNATLSADHSQQQNLTAFRIHEPYEIKDRNILQMTRKLFRPSLCLFEKMYGWAVKIVTKSERRS